MKNKYNYDKLRGRIREYCKTNKSFAEELNISEQSLNLKLNGITCFKQSEIDKAMKILKISDKEIIPIFFTKEVEKN